MGSGAAVDWGDEGPDGAPTDKFTVALEGYIRFPYAETYEFKILYISTMYSNVFASSIVAGV